MAHTSFKKIFEPFMMELRLYSNHLQPKSVVKSFKPPITKFEVPNGEADGGKTPIAYAIRMKNIKTTYTRSLPKKAPTPLVKFPGYPSSVRPGIYFPPNWRWYAEKKVPDKYPPNDPKRHEPTPDDCQRKLNISRLEELKRKLNDSSMLRGSKSKKDE